MNPDSTTALGMYPIDLTFTPDGVAANALIAHFIVHVYPETEYQNPNASTTCTSGIWPFFLYPSAAGTNILWTDIDNSNENMLLCGVTKNKLAVGTTY